MSQSSIFYRSSEPNQFSRQNLYSLFVEATPIARSLVSLRQPHIAIGTGSSGRTFLGFDVELPGLPLSLSIHAEQFLLVNLKQSQEPHLRQLAISSDGFNFFRPCGNCSELLHEISRSNELRLLIGEQATGRLAFVALDKMFPPQFSPYGGLRDQTHARYSDVLDPQRCDFKLFLENNGFDMFKTEAHSAAKSSYAPYSGAQSGVALMDVDGKIYTGSFIESAASNTSIDPVRAALINFVMATGGRAFGKITHAVLVEKRGRFVQEAAAEMILKAISPACSFKVYYIRD